MKTSATSGDWEVRKASFPMVKNYAKRITIYKQGYVSEGFYLIKSGSVKLQKTMPNGAQTIIQLVTAGGIFGQGCCNPSSQSFNTCYAISLEENTLIQKFDGNKIQLSNYDSVLPEKLLESNLEICNRLERLIWMDADQRIKFTLKDLAQKMGKRFGDETLLKINLTHKELGMLTDSSRQTVTKTLSNLKKEGKINYSRNRILFRNLSTFN
jgi:CRP/FNR family transcriptional regulator